MIFKPFIKLHKITDISPALLKDNGIKGLILDVDNTLSTHHGSVLTNGLEEWLLDMQKAGIKLIILSNSKNKRVEPFAKSIGLDFIALGLKPLPFGYFKAARAIGLKRSETAIVGDQLFTDSLGGNLSRVRPIILDPILPESMWSFRIKRSLERKLYKKYGYKEEA